MPFAKHCVWKSDANWHPTVWHLVWMLYGIRLPNCYRWLVNTNDSFPKWCLDLVVIPNPNNGMPNNCMPFVGLHLPNPTTKWLFKVWHLMANYGCHLGLIPNDGQPQDAKWWHAIWFDGQLVLGLWFPQTNPTITVEGFPTLQLFACHLVSIQGSPILGWYEMACDCHSSSKVSQSFDDCWFRWWNPTTIIDNWCWVLKPNHNCC